FPFLEVDVVDSETRDTEIRVVSVDVAGVSAAAGRNEISSDTAAVYRLVNTGVTQGKRCAVSHLQGTFGPLGVQSAATSSLAPPSAGAGRKPADRWTAIRLLTEGTDVQLTLKQGSTKQVLSGKRARYLDDHGALAQMFLPGELTQSLCSPWTHDFRDCGCFYWA